MGRKALRGLVLIAMPLICTACQVMPVEEELPAAPVIRSYEEKEYAQSPVMRGDLTLSMTVSCTYVAAKQEDLSFSLGGEYIGHVYVSKGQQVQAGELLAELEAGDLSEQISDQEYVLKVLNMKKSNIQENRDLELYRQDVLLAGMEQQLESMYEQMQEQQTESLDVQMQEQQLETMYEQIQEQQEQRESVVKSYREQLRDIEDSLYIENLRLEELKKSLAERQIYAGIDGIVTYVRTVKEGDRSVEGITFITVSDLDTTVFTVKEEYAQYFPVGTQVTILSGKKEFRANAVDGTELGLAQSEETQESVVYLQLVQPDPTLEDGTKGKIEIIPDQRQDVLYVVKKAVKTANGEPFVYMLDENGLKIMQKVTTGLDNGTYVEIVSGLEEGDSVIVE